MQRERIQRKPAAQLGSSFTPATQQVTQAPTSSLPVQRSALFGHSLNNISIHAPSSITAQREPEEEEHAQLMRDPFGGHVQREPEEEPVQMMRGPAFVQREADPEEEQMQAQAFSDSSAAPSGVPAQSNKSLGLMVQRDNIVQLHPTMRSSSRREVHNLQQLSDAAMTRLPMVGRGYVNEWFSAMSAGINSVPEPDDPRQKRYWWIALAGNLGWAASSLIAPEYAIAIRALSFAGAAVGSGAVQQLAPTEAAPSGRQMLITQLARVRDRMVGGHLPSILIDVVGECVEQYIGDQTRQDTILWNRLFPGIPQANSSEAIVTQAISRTQEILPVFMAQFVAWDARVNRESMNHVVAAAHSDALDMHQSPIREREPGEPASRLGLALSVRIFPQAEAAGPFRPVLPEFN
jgi:hypothetical protein